MALPRLPTDVLSYIAVDMMEKSRHRRKLMHLTEKELATAYTEVEDGLLRARLETFFGPKNWSRIETALASHGIEPVPTLFWDLMWQKILSRSVAHLYPLPPNGKLLIYVQPEDDAMNFVRVSYADIVASNLTTSLWKLEQLNQSTADLNNSVKTWFSTSTHELTRWFEFLTWLEGKGTFRYVNLARCFTVDDCFGTSFDSPFTMQYLIYNAKVFYEYGHDLIQEHFQLKYNDAYKVYAKCARTLTEMLRFGFRSVCTAYLDDPTLKTDDSTLYQIFLLWIAPQVYEVRFVTNYKLMWLCRSWELELRRPNELSNALQQALIEHLRVDRDLETGTISSQLVNLPVIMEQIQAALQVLVQRVSRRAAAQAPEDIKYVIPTIFDLDFDQDNYLSVFRTAQVNPNE